MRYLVQHRKEFAVTVTAFIIAVINLINAIKDGVLDADLIIAVIMTAIGICAWYLNMPTSEENSKHTTQMRLEKKKEELPVGYWEDEVICDEDPEGGEA